MHSFMGGGDVFVNVAGVGTRHKCGSGNSMEKAASDPTKEELSIPRCF